jgi:hypothetical protein
MVNMIERIILSTKYSAGSSSGRNKKDKRAGMEIV